MRKSTTKPGGYKRPPAEPTKVASVKVTDTDRKYIESQHYNLSAAIRLLTKGGKYEELIERNAELERIIFQACTAQKPLSNISQDGHWTPGED